MPGRHLLVHVLLVHFLLFAAAGTQAAEPTYFKFSELMDSELSQAIKDPAVKLYWATQPTPGFPEIAPADVYARRGPLTQVGGPTSNCVAAFHETLKTLISDARSRGYDAIINLQAAEDGRPSNDREGFRCVVGDKRVKVALWSQFAMSAAALQRMVEADEHSTRMPPRQAPTNGMFIPLEPILTSPQAREILGPDIHVFWGVAAPRYGLRYGPDSFSESASNRDVGDEGACRRAVLESLKSMVKDAEERGLNAIIRVRSFIDERYPPVITDAECRQRLFMAGRLSVSLQASLASIADESIGFAPVPARPASKDAIFLPLGPILASPEAQAILGPNLKAYWEFKVPKYSQHKKPEVYSESVTLGTLTPQEACKQVVLKALEEMAATARDGKFDSIIRIRSYLGGKYAPVPTDFECKLAKNEASAELRATLVRQ
jgi:uncharacterized protein YbjQ (UPF0145 family)